jgi:hypothetical protein
MGDAETLNSGKIDDEQGCQSFTLVGIAVSLSCSLLALTGSFAYFSSLSFRSRDELIEESAFPDPGSAG